MNRTFRFIFVFALLAAPAAAQTAPCTTLRPGPSWVCLDGGWLPPGHPLTPPGTTPTPGFQPRPDLVCDPLPNPYTEPDLAAECARRDLRPKQPGLEFQVGRRYYFGFPSAGVAVCTGVSVGYDGIPIGTLQFLNLPIAQGSRAGDVIAIRFDQSANWSEFVDQP